MELGIKKKRYWLRGGIVGGIFSPMIILLLAILFQSQTVGSLILPIPGLVSFIENNVNLTGCGPDGACLIPYVLFFSIFVFIFWFAVGAFLGLIYGKIKNRKSSQLTPRS